ncbi:MAG: serine/threonine protein kinase [Planctomycetaceae bacterium]|nr:MAG: serine/threonine protein kinase [Planctomycetaceae bacterium]
MRGHIRVESGIVIVALLLGGRVSAWGGDHWPAFRGADARGVADDARLPDHWSASENVAWKLETPGRGWSSPIVWGDRVFLTTCIDSGAPPEARKGLYFGGEQSKPPQRNHDWKVLCYELATGKPLWEKTVHQGIPQTPIHVKNTYASETPLTDGQHVYAYFGNVGLYCLDFDGNVVWSKTMEPRKTQMNWGPAASPALADGKLYIVNDNQDESYLQALNAADGQEEWRVSRDEQSNWSTPYVWKNDRRTEVVTAGTRKIRSYDLAGKLLWEIAGMSPITIATPYESKGLLYVSSGYVLAPSKPIYAIRPGAQGDISLGSTQTSSDHIAWCQKTAAPYNPSTLIYRDRLYVLYDRGLFACYDAVTGKEIYSKQRLGASEYTASPWANAGQIFCLSESGETVVIEAGDEFRNLHTNRLEDDDMCMATPAIASDRLLIRTVSRLYCIRKAEL